MKMSRGRAPCCAKVGLNKGSWMPEEDMRLIAYIHKYGHGNWRALPRLAGLARCGKSCRLRWINYLRPDIKRGNFSKEEEETIIKLHELLGNKWSKIASYLPGRTDNEIKNVWNTHLKKRVTPKEQKSLEDPPSSTSSITTFSTSCSSDEGESNKLGKEQTVRIMENAKEIYEPNLNSWNMQSLCTSTSDVGQNAGIDHLLDLPEIMIEPSEIWNMIEGGDQDGRTLEAESNGGDESNSWLAYLEKELDLREEECNFDYMSMEGGDPVANYFQELQFSSFHLI